MGILKTALYWARRLFLIFIIFSILITLVYRFIPVFLTPLMVIRLVEQGSDEKREVRIVKTWVPMEQISRHMAQAVVAAEDQKFLDHFGFDRDAIQQALEKNKSGGSIRGGSTISNQTAKNVFLWPGRNYLRKGLEAYFTVLIEFFWPKERILEVYLNIIETGDGIFGVEAASQTFFNKPAQNLSPEEAAMIASILPGPLRWSPANPTAYIYKRQSWILRNMNNLPPIDFGN